MNNPEDYASDTDDSDCDFDPKAHDSHAELSEEDEDDVIESAKKNSRKKINEEPKAESEPKEIPEVDGKKADDLWASFQSDVEEKEPASNGSKLTARAASSNSVKKPALPQRTPPLFPSALKRPGGGLGNILGQLGKKNKLSVLEQSKKDWSSFKDEEGINEELNTFNKGKNG